MNRSSGAIMGYAARLTSGGYSLAYGDSDAVGVRQGKADLRRLATPDVGFKPAPSPAQVTVSANAAWADARPLLSVLTPFLRDDPSGLLAAIQAQAARLSVGIEIVALDDGTDDPVLAAQVTAAVQALAMPAAFVRLSKNEGRAAARNRLAQFARGRHLLYLDADTVPDRADFLAAYVEMIQADDPALVIGGFSLIQASREPRYELHRAIATQLDCMPAPVRQVMPWRFVYGSNILVRRDVMQVTPFNPDYRAWGWEDQEWGMRVADRWPILHVDNTVSHMGLDVVPTLLDKYASSGANFHRILADHPDRVKNYPAYRAARALSIVPFKSAFRGLARRAALSEVLPLKARAFALRLFRVLNYLASH